MESFKDQTGFTLGERCAMFNWRFKTKVMTVRILRRIYYEHQVKKKKIRITKEWTPRDPLKKVECWAARARDLERMQEEKCDIIYVDEVMFTKHTYETETWSVKRQNVEIDQQHFNMTPLACCVAVSERHGLDLCMIWPKSVNTQRFQTFLRRLRAKYPFRRMCLYMDNLSVHKANAT